MVIRHSAGTRNGRRRKKLRSTYALEKEEVSGGLGSTSRENGKNHKKLAEKKRLTTGKKLMYLPLVEGRERGTVVDFFRRTRNKTNCTVKGTQPK